MLASVLVEVVEVEPGAVAGGGGELGDGPAGVRAEGDGLVQPVDELVDGDVEPAAPQEAVVRQRVQHRAGTAACEREGEACVC